MLITSWELMWSFFIGDISKILVALKLTNWYHVENRVEMKQSCQFAKFI